MKTNIVLFDLDGTLLPMDQDVFTKEYFKLLAAKLAPRGYEQKKLIDAVWAGTAAMVQNDGSVKNYEAFWKKFAQIMGEKVYEDKALFDEFYKNEFDGAAQSCGFNPDAARAVALCKELGFRVALATNPIFPREATISRIRWAGFEPNEFEYYTTYEVCSFCKPNLDYYREIMRTLGCSPEECLMVGNDVSEDMVANNLGMKVFLLTDCLINKKNEDITRYPNGGFPELSEFLTSLA